MGLRLRLLGGFEMRAGERLVEVSMSARRVLAFLALRDREVARVYLAGMLWPDAPEARSLGNLRTALWDLHASGCAPIAATPRHVRIADDVDIDVRAAMAAAQDAIDGRDMAAFVREFGWSAELLPDWYDDWVGTERERITQFQLLALDSVAANALDERRYAHAIEACLLAIRLDSLRETSQRLLLRAHLAQGNRSDARRQYRHYEERLRAEYGLEPSPEMRTLRQSL